MMEPAGSAALVKQIEAEALRLGFCLFGVTNAESPLNYPIYEAWLADGLNAGMSYLASDYHRDSRRDLHRWMPSVKSILVLGWSYPLTLQLGDRPQGWIAGYATETDYHEKLMTPLSELANYIEKITGKAVEHKPAIDSAPVLERELAQRAGLGWIARNSCLISPNVGSNVLLEELFLSIELPTSIPITVDRCGKCHRCVDTCPTQCIREDRTIDSGKCIAYLTIENKGGIPPELRDSIGTWVFGCDICQTVCPWNSRQNKLAREPVDGAYLEIEEMVAQLELGPEAFKAKFGQSPRLRAKRNGYRRNLITVLGNLRTEAAIAPLKRLLESETDENLREIIQWALVKIGA